MSKFFATPEGKILGFGVHEHVHGLIKIKHNLAKLKEEMIVSPPNENISKYFQKIEEGITKCQESIDYVYSKIKALHSDDLQS